MRDLGIKFMVAQWDDVGNVIFLFFWMNSLWTDGYLCPSQILKFNLTPLMWDVGSVPRLGRSPGEGNGNPLQYSCLENPMGRGACGLQFMGLQSGT